MELIVVTGQPNFSPKPHKKIKIKKNKKIKNKKRLKKKEKNSYRLEGVNE